MSSPTKDWSRKVAVWLNPAREKDAARGDEIRKHSVKKVTTILTNTKQQVAEQAAAVYCWLLGNCSKPAYVFLD